MNALNACIASLPPPGVVPESEEAGGRQMAAATSVTAEVIWPRLPAINSGASQYLQERFLRYNSAKCNCPLAFGRWRVDGDIV